MFASFLCFCFTIRFVHSPSGFLVLYVCTFVHTYIRTYVRFPPLPYHPINLLPHPPHTPNHTSPVLITFITQFPSQVDTPTQSNRDTKCTVPHFYSLNKALSNVSLPSSSSSSPSPLPLPPPPAPPPPAPLLLPLLPPQVATLQAELELLKEFRTGKVAMEREMGELNDKMDAMASEHKGLVSRMEERFAEEKVGSYVHLCTVSVHLEYATYMCMYIHTYVHTYICTRNVGHLSVLLLLCSFS